jgi:hypothetical protein
MCCLTPWPRPHFRIFPRSFKRRQSSFDGGSMKLAIYVLNASVWLICDWCRRSSWCAMLLSDWVFE